MFRGLMLVALTGCQVVFPLTEPPPPLDAPPAPTCPTGYIGVASLYRFDPTPVSWKAAQDLCRADSQGLTNTRSTHLIVVSSLDENMAAHTFVSGAEVWIGLTDLPTDGQFNWITTEDDTNVFGKDTAAEPWMLPEPNGSALENCVEQRGDGRYNDLPCDTLKAFICECDDFDTVDARVP